MSDCIARVIDNRTIHVFDKEQFDLYAIRNCGQIFLDPPCMVHEENDKFVIRATGDKDSDWLWNFFDFGTDYRKIIEKLECFEELRKPIELGRGIRILCQDFKQCVVSFIISANNNIKRFTKTLEQIDFDNLDKYTEEDFKRFGCGYRAHYLVNTIKQLNTINFEMLGALDNSLLHRRLLELSGVGDKVARCIMLFCFHRLDVVPVDTWIEKAQDAGIDFSKFGNYAGVAQQYIFYFMQHLKKQP